MSNAYNDPYNFEPKWICDGIEYSFQETKNDLEYKYQIRKRDDTGFPYGFLIIIGKNQEYSQIYVDEFMDFLSKKTRWVNHITLQLYNLKIKELNLSNIRTRIYKLRDHGGCIEKLTHDNIDVGYISYGNIRKNL